MLAPTLVVGLGGTGSDIVQKVARLASDTEKNRIAFVVFDTDVNELREIREKNSFIETVQTSTPLTVGEYLNIDTHARDNWFPVNKILCRKTLTEGAGQVRAISRLALDTAIRAGKLEPLHKAIENLYKLDGEQSSQALRVIIVSSLAGGTGSGLILPVSLYIRNFLRTRFQQSASIIRGFFILPEVFYDVIKGQSERNNLKCNAYATIRELDAFLMKGDDSLPESYEKKLKFEFPRIGSQECEEYDVMPFDFCFLFDAQNVDGKKLNSFAQYKQHAASCIYAQSIGPMNKRSNSSEDNVIRELCKAGGRNRYCGAGSSMLMYPFKDVREYIALQWATQCVSTQWLTYDKEYKEKSIQINQMRSQGYAVREIDPGLEYIASVEASDRTKNGFGGSIVNACSTFDPDGLTKTGTKWQEYIDNLNAYITDCMSTGQADLDEQKTMVDRCLSGLSGDSKAEWDVFQTTFGEMKKYLAMVKRRSEDLARTMAYTMFKAENKSVTKEKNKATLETYLYTSTGEFMHPNAIRYFLYNVIEEFKREQAIVDKELSEYQEYFANYEARTFDDPKTEGVIETADDSRKRFVREDFVRSFKKYAQTVDTVRVKSIYAEIVRAGIDYAAGLSKAFEIFYASFEGGVASISRTITDISNKYKFTKGDTTRYVCASKTCLEKLNMRLPFTGNSLRLSTELCDRIYMKVRDYAMMQEKPKGNKFFTELFDKDILQYFRDTVMTKYQSEVDIDVIRALELEAEYEHELYDSDSVMNYVKKALKETKKLSAPFIEAPLGEERAPVCACAFNPCLDQKDNPPRHALVDSELRNDGGVSDYDIEKNTIIFYKAIYGLRANDLSKFSPARVAETASATAGEYFKAYFELINQIKPKSQETPVITPHIDRSWHIITMLPDLDEKNQKAQENDIYKAFMYGIIFNKIQYTQISVKRTWYKLVLSGNSSEDFVVSNRTPCDTFYEVLDALTINPIVVKGIIEAVEDDFRKERLSNKRPRIEDSILSKNLEEFYVKEYSEDRLMSFIDILMLLKISTPADEFRDQTGIDLLKVMFLSIYEYVTRMCPQDEIDNVYGKLIMQQYAIFQNNLEWYDENWGEVFGVYVQSIFENLIHLLQSKELEKEAIAVVNDAKQYNNTRIKKYREKALK